jgi:hypothetical protein
MFHAWRYPWYRRDRMQASTKFARELGERACLIGWVILLMATTVMIGWSVELLVMGAALACNNCVLIDSGTLPFLMLGVVAMLNFPVVIKLHELGVTYLHFEEHENVLNTKSESWGSLIETLLDESEMKSRQLEKLIREISDATSAAERQERRREAKAWLMENQAKLSEEDQGTVDEHLGYLKIPSANDSAKRFSGD